MKRCIILFLLFHAAILGAQERLGQYGDLCSRSALHVPAFTQPELSSSSRRVPTPCPKPNISDFAVLSAQELFDYLISVEDPYTCVNRVIYGFHSDHSPLVFDKAKVQFIAEQTSLLVASFDGINDNGVHAAYIYLSIAGLQATFHASDIPFDATTWNAIQQACVAFVSNEDISLDHETSLYTMGHMFFAASFDSVGIDSLILDKGKQLLDDIAADGYLGQTDYYPYYYCLYYLLDVYFRYPTDILDFIHLTADQEEVITSLKNVATNLNINANTFTFFEDLSNFSVTAITRYAPHDTMQSVVEPALLEIADTYPEDDYRWVESALALVQNDMDFHLTEEEILGSLQSVLFPYEFEFEDGNIKVLTPLEYEEVLPLYQAATEVRAQFFRMLQQDQALPADTNEVLNIVLYGTRDDYRSFNNLLFGVNYPNSGGVYIERYASFYTYQRTPEQSSYSLEALFRHEYTHYLQGRYIVEGEWGMSDAYDNSRLVWFEEGMAQFFSGSTRSSNLKILELIRTTIQNTGNIQDLQSVLASSYSSGNPDAYYIYGAMFWAHLYYSDRDQFIQFVELILNEEYASFDALVNYYANSASEATEFSNFIDSVLLQNDIWIDPQSPGIHPDDIDPYDIDSLADEVSQLIANVIIDTAEVSVYNRPRRFKVSGQMSIDEPTNTLGEALDERLNIYLNNLELSSLNNFHHATAYATNVTELESGGATASFHIEGPINDFCQTVDVIDISFESFENFVVFIPPANLIEHHEFRYRALGSEDWSLLSISNADQDTLFMSDATSGFEVELRYECSSAMWSDYSNSFTFYLCPDTRNVQNDIMDNSAYAASVDLTSSSVLSDSAEVHFIAGQSIELESDFEIESGAILTISNQDCRSKQ